MTSHQTLLMLTVVLPFGYAVTQSSTSQGNVAEASQTNH